MLAAAVFHDMVNVSYSLFPVNGSYYNPAVTGVIEAVIAVAIIITQEIRRRYPVSPPNAGLIIPVSPRPST